MQPTPQNVEGQKEHKHSNGKISIVSVEIACMVVRCIRVANLPPEVQDAVLHNTVSNNGDVNDIKEGNGLDFIDIRFRMESELWN